ncbi:MAG: sel1 repeat family protein, partial [Alphaproteobacteria bacterium]|nr:sel1 repeat family protein [Alphaproteobacteria bacterium]
MSTFALGVIAYDAGDFKTALRVWSPLAETGHVVAAYNLGNMNLKGQGTKKDPIVAAKWLHLAAKSGHAQAQLTLAALYAEGNGIPKDQVQAAVLAHQAAARFPPGANREKALGLAAAIRRALTPEELAMVEELLAAEGLEMASAPPRKLDPRDPADFRKTVLSYRDRTKLQGDTLVAGNVQMLGLEEAKKRAGDKWAEAKTRVYTIVEEAIEHHLSELDLFVRASEEQFILLFGSSLRVEAERTARDIGHEIERRLAEEIPGGIEISVRSIAIPIQAGKDGGAISSFEALAATLRQAQAKVETEEKAKVDLVRAGATMAFWPLAQLRKRLISVYVLEIVPPAGLAPDRNAPNGTGVYNAEIDNLTVERAGEAMTKAGGKGNKAVLLVPVHYETISSKAYRDRLLATCRRLPIASSRRMMFHVVDLPPGVPQSRLNQVFGMFKPFAVGFAVGGATSFDQFDLFQGLKTFLFTIDGNASDPTAGAEFEALRGLVARAAKGRLRVAFLGAKSVKVGTQARRAGSSYAAGPAVFPRVA